MSPAWQIAHLVGIAAGMFLTLSEDDAPYKNIPELCQCYTAELTDLVARKDGAA